MRTALIAGLLGLLAIPAGADLAATLELGGASAQVVRGEVRQVDPVATARLDLVGKRLSVSLEGVAPVAGPLRGDWTQVDLGVNYRPFIVKGTSIGLVQSWRTRTGGYSLPMVGLPLARYKTTEAYVRARVGHPVRLQAAIHRDIDAVGGCYGYVGAGLSIGPLDVDAYLGAGTAAYNRHYYGVDESAITDFEVAAVADLPLLGGVRVKPSVRYTVLTDSMARQTAAKPDNFVVGLALVAEF